MPFFPQIGGRTIRCPQLPTTLPTLDELIGRNDLHWGEPVAHLLDLTRHPLPLGHVYTLHAELEGMKLLSDFGRLLDGWRAQGWQLGALDDYFAQVDPTRIPVHPVRQAEIAGRSGTLALQSD
jgi:hypothetical protein